MHLTPRELDVLELVVEGRINKEIAARLFISPETVKQRVRSLLGKLGARNRTHLVAIAFRRGLVS